MSLSIRRFDALADGTDDTKVLALDLSSITTATTRTFTFPDATTTAVGTDTTQTLTNKTLTTPIISSISNTGTLTLPTSTDTLVGRDTTDTLTNKTLTAPVLNGVTTFSLDDAGGFDLVLQSASALTADRNLTIDVNDANRTVDLTGNLTLGGNFTTSGASGLVLTTTAATNVTLPTTGTLATLAGTETLTNKTLTSPRIGTSILDTAGLELFLITATGSAVNQLTYANAATGANPSFTASGDDTNVGITMVSKGTGTHVFDNDTAEAEIRLIDAAGTDYIGLKPASATTSYTLTLPAAQGGANEVLTNNGAGVLSWSAAPTETESTFQTTNATTQTIATIATTSNNTYLVDMIIVARRSDAGSESAGYSVKATYRNVSTTLTRVGTDDVLSQEDTNQWKVETDASSEDIRVRVTGQIGKTIEWKCVYRTVSISFA